jgi:biotin carboxylase
MHRNASVPPADRRVLVVGTTADYIQWLRRCRPGQVLFLTDPAVRREADEPAPSTEEELLCDLADAHRVLDALAGHLEKWQIGLDGIACYDCESMALAARVARAFSLPYPGIQSVDNCRDKYRSRILWRNHGLDVPEVRRIDSSATAIDFFRETDGPCVLKPLSGSGSELIFRCNSEADCARHYRRIHQGLEQRRDHRLYRPQAGGAPAIIAETYIDGEEYSCDFVLQDGRATPIRLARKVRFARDPFGTAGAYILPGAWPQAIDAGQFERTLYRSARALGIQRAVCMLDVIVDNGKMVLLELAPRPGGDCLPSLVRRCYGLDVLQLMLDFARRQPMDVHPPPTHPPMVGLRLHAEKEGVLVGIDTRDLRQDPRVQEIQLIRKPGHRIKRPPEDYDAWLLGHAIFVPDPHTDIAAQCRTLCDKLTIEVAQ